ncbi:major paralogous domain-containing protein [Mucilaginibacter pineti]|uniref:Major paralogous domain-containing protein n=1 Tax=Mucilaginibacter pineti TaxID=1391627 RepID=A0A1G7C132_9SPHI|nr:fibrobacter succinogenes major paralogous domain-containing protein [Mucilaginibacter pineti]SDE32997.1 major paralogous domain-containing protein [Mucilaginibacter pineti]
MKFSCNALLFSLMIMLFGCAKKDKVAPPDPVSPNLSAFTIPAKIYGDVPFDIIAPKSNSTGAFSYTSSNLKVATISGKTITVKGSGSSVITAIQAAAGNFTADSMKYTLNVGLTAPTLSGFTIPNKSVNDAPFTLTNPKSNSPGVFTFKSNDTTRATVTGNKVTIKSAGSCTIVAIQAASGSYRADTIQATFNIAGLIMPTLTNFVVPTKKISDPVFTLTAPKSNSVGAFTYKSTNFTVATVSGNQVTIKGIGKTDIIATQVATGAYSGASISVIFTVVDLPTPTLSGFTIPAKKPTDAPFTLVAPKSNSTGAFTYSSSNTAVATITGNKVTIKGTGQTQIIATQARTITYASESIAATLTVSGTLPPGSVMDVDGNVYTTVTIGTQTWMVENLRVTHFNEGSSISNFTSDKDWQTLTPGTSAYCDYNNDANTALVYGKLYNWYAVTSLRGLAPKGFHIPTDAEWTTLYNYLGGVRESGGKLQEVGTAHWETQVTATNSTKFTALPSGARNNEESASFSGLRNDANWWSTTASSSTNAWYYNIYIKGYFERHDVQKTAGFAVRCIKD